MPLHDDERFVAPLLWWEGRETARKNGGRCLPCRGDGAASCVNSIVGQDTRTVALSLPSSLTAGPDAEGNRGAGRSSRPLSPIHRRYEMSSRPVQYRNRSSVNCDPALGHREPSTPNTTRRSTLPRLTNGPARSAARRDHPTKKPRPPSGSDHTRGGESWRSIVQSVRPWSCAVRLGPLPRANARPALRGPPPDQSPLEDDERHARKLDAAHPA